MYVWGKPICARCAGPIIQAGIKRIVAPWPESVPEDSKWRETGIWAKKMFEESKITTDYYRTDCEISLAHDEHCRCSDAALR